MVVENFRVGQQTLKMRFERSPKRFEIEPPRVDQRAIEIKQHAMYQGSVPVGATFGAAVWVTIAFNSSPVMVSFARRTEAAWRRIGCCEERIARARSYCSSIRRRTSQSISRAVSSL